MKILMCLAALFILSTAAPGAWEDDPGYRAYLAMIYGPWAETAARGRSAVGADACDRGTLNANDVISQKFMDDHICLVRKSPPKDLPAFCRDFRRGQPKYQVMLLGTNSIKQLRYDLIRHQNDFYNDRSKFRPLNPGVGQVHYTTDQPYTFIYCELIRGRWIGRQKTGRYQQYIPIGTAGNPQGVYKIYHGCPPVVSYPGFSQPGSC